MKSEKKNITYWSGDHKVGWQPLQEHSVVRLPRSHAHVSAGFHNCHRGMCTRPCKGAPVGSINGAAIVPGIPTQILQLLPDAMAGAAIARLGLNPPCLAKASRGSSLVPSQH